MILKGEKIYLEDSLRKEDYPAILKGYTDLSIIGFVYFAKQAAKLKTIDEVKNFVHEVKGETIFGIYANDNDEFVGYATLEPEDANACEYSIFILDKKYWGKGVGEEVTKIMIEYVLRELKFEKITLTVSDLHKKAIALYEKMGFKKKQLVLNDRDVFLDNKWIRSGTIEMEKLC